MNYSLVLKHRNRSVSAGALVVAAALLAGCAAGVKEKHFFASFKETAPGVREPVQFYRLTVQGDANFSNARYLSGFFDERAVSLFFNELKSPANSKLFDDAVKLPGAPDGTKLEALSPTPDNGAFVMILSTNADAIANAIGSFAESQVVSDALTRILNKDRFLAKAQSDASLSVQKVEAVALIARLDAETTAAATSRTGVDATVSYVRALSALAQSLGYTGPEFGGIPAAQEWFALENAQSRGTR